MRTILAARCVHRKRQQKKDDELIVWARGVVATPNPLITEYERCLIASLLLQVEASR